MSLRSIQTLLPLSLCVLMLTACGQKAATHEVSGQQNPQFYSKIAREVVAHFTAQYRSKVTSLEDFQKLSAAQKRVIEIYEIPETLAYLFGPLTTREIGGPKRNQTVNVDWSSATLSDKGTVEVTYSYEGTWILENSVADSFEIPLPYNIRVVLTPNWKKCTDSDPEHQTQDFFWYFWDPKRRGCDHAEGTQYQKIQVTVGDETVMQTNTFPEYNHLIESNGLKKNLQMTFAFGYIEDEKTPNPDTDTDEGVIEYQKFLKKVRSMKTDLKLKETPVLESEYKGSVRGEQQIGYRFEGKKDGVKISITVVAAADIDQMELFAKSFAHDHDGFFGWFGHSRVGSGFDANNFKAMVNEDPNYYSISPEYQLIYWGGCNSYSYYSLPFFKFKADLSPSKDPNGTKALDILGNGLPSLFAFNAFNAGVALKAMINWQEPTSYQHIVNTIEGNAAKSNQKVLVNILGDEDNE